MSANISSLATYSIYIESMKSCLLCQAVSDNELQAVTLKVLFICLFSYQPVQLDYFFIIVIHIHKHWILWKGIFRTYFFSQIIHIRSYQFEPLTDNTEGIESFKSKVHGTLTQSDNEETPN